MNKRRSYHLVFLTLITLASSLINHMLGAVPTSVDTQTVHETAKLSSRQRRLQKRKSKTAAAPTLNSSAPLSTTTVRAHTPSASGETISTMRSSDTSTQDSTITPTNTITTRKITSLFPDTITVNPTANPTNTVESITSHNNTTIAHTPVTHEPTTQQASPPIPSQKIELGFKPLPLELATPQALTPQTSENKNAVISTMPSGSSEAKEEQKQEEQSERIEFNFEDTDLQTLVTYIENLFNVTFISDDMISPLPQDSHSLKGNKISFKTNKLLTRQEAWDLFITFLSISGFTVVPDSDPSRYRIKTIDAAKRSPITSYIGVDAATLPNSDEIIRYVYFVENKNRFDTIKTILEKLRSTASDLILLTNHNAFILTDKAYNIKTLMQIIKELDKQSSQMPQSMSVLKLRRADAQDVKNLYDSLIGPGANSTPQQLFQARKQPTSLYFPENTTIIAEPRTNSLILLGTKESINKIESFIVKHIDIELDTPYSPLYVYQLKYADAITIADIMSTITRDFAQSNSSVQHGGVRGADKFMKPIFFTPEETTNRLIIKGHYEDYKAAEKIIDKLDKAQPQVAIEVLILSVTVTNQKQLGAQIRSKDPGVNGLLGNNIKFQTSGLFQNKSIDLRTAGIGTEAGVTRLLGNLVSLATGAAAGNTVITLGSDTFGVWGIFQALQVAANAQIVSNPFLVATNKTKATISVGETRRVQTGVVFSGGSSGTGVGGVPTFNDEPANLKLEVTPQINSDGMIVLKLAIDITNFTNPSDEKSATKTVRRIETSTIVANQEVLALGGLIKNNISNSAKKTPILGNIPILGWLFKNHNKSEDKDNLLVLLSTRIIEPHQKKDVRQFNTEKIDDYHGCLAKMNHKADTRDPIHRLFFAPGQGSTEEVMDDFLLRRAHLEGQSSPEKPKNKRAQRLAKRLQKKNAQKNILAQPQESTITASIASPTYQEQLNHKIAMPKVNTLAQEHATLDVSSRTQIALQNKKRTKLSLTDFFDNTKAHA